MARIIGLTGGIASGKSTVTSYLKEKGYPVIDADRVVHDLQAPGGELYQALVEHFGRDILLDTGDLNRPALAQRIFSSQKRDYLVQPSTRRDHSQSPGARTGPTSCNRRPLFHGYSLVNRAGSIWTGLTKSGWSM